jgi:hypothetical protein
MNVLNDSAREESKEVAHVETVFELFSYLLENTLTTARRRYTSRGNLSLLNSLAKGPVCRQPEEIFESPLWEWFESGCDKHVSVVRDAVSAQRAGNRLWGCGDVWGSGARQGTRYFALILNMTLQLHHPVEGN